MNNLTETQKAYLAGLLDGEGCVGISHTKSKNNLHEWDYRLRVIITNSNFEVMEWIKDVTGVGSAYKNKKSFKSNWNEIHRWQVVAEQAREFLRQVQPYCIIKRDIINLCLQLPKAHKRGRTDEVYNEQSNIFNLAKEKNRRGKAA